MAAGRRSIIPFQTERTSSYRASPGRTSRPPSASPSLSNPFVSANPSSRFVECGLQQGPSAELNWRACIAARETKALARWRRIGEHPAGKAAAVVGN
jgi:hypothetical protein